MPDAPDLHSMYATGQLGDQWLYTGNRFKRFAVAKRMHARPYNPTPCCYPLVVKQATAEWHTMTDEEKAPYATPARWRKTEPYVEFIREQLRLHSLTYIHILGLCCV
jgi:hypothetical protein